MKYKKGDNVLVLRNKWGHGLELFSEHTIEGIDMGSYVIDHWLLGEDEVVTMKAFKGELEGLPELLRNIVKELGPEEEKKLQRGINKMF